MGCWVAGRRTCTVHLGSAGAPQRTDEASVKVFERRVLQRGMSFTLLPLVALALYHMQATLYEDDFKTTFFGDHYAELECIKHEYDPNDLFIVPKGVGSDRWKDDLVCQK